MSTAEIEYTGQTFEELLPMLRASGDPVCTLVAEQRPALAIVTAAQLVPMILVSQAKAFTKGRNTQLWPAFIGDGTAIRKPLAETTAAEVVSEITTWRRYLRRSIIGRLSGSRLSDYRQRLVPALDTLAADWVAEPGRDLLEDSRRLAFLTVLYSFGAPELTDDLSLVDSVLFDSRQTAYDWMQQENGRAAGGSSQCPAGHGSASDVVVESRFAAREAAVKTAFESVIAHSARADTVFGDIAQAVASYPDLPVRAAGDQARAFFAAALQNMTTTLTWLMWHVAADKSVQDRLLQSEDGRYADAVVSETLRLHPPSWSIPRESMVPLRIAGTEYARGTVFVTSPLIQHFQPAAWPRPEEFDPERFTTERGADGTYFPFGLGVRRCPAQSFARQQAGLLIRSIVRDWELTLADPEQMPAHLLGVELDSVTSKPVRFHATARQPKGRHAEQ
ncbi:cytochrome P450 [Kribbella sp. NPDC023855]|uniref:cytochrome P450 n=1 Tax=Kribbella sp. NPDC023855 TaxID=3154698 RepID=UPI0034074B76